MFQFVSHTTPVVLRWVSPFQQFSVARTAGCQYIRCVLARIISAVWATQGCKAGCHVKTVKLESTEPFCRR